MRQIWTGASLGLAIGAGIGVFEGFREGAEEFKQSGELDKAITKGLGGFAESITFGLVDKDDYH